MSMWSAVARTSSILRVTAPRPAFTTRSKFRRTAARSLRLARGMLAHPFADFDEVVEQRRADADAFYAELQAELDSPDARGSSAKPSPA